MKTLLWVLLFALFTGCSASADVPDEIQMRINSYTVLCEGVVEGECLLIQEGNKIGTEDWEYFYFKDDIEGFTFEPGFVYLLTIKKTPIQNPPVDGSSIRYELIKIVSKVKDEK